MRKPERGQLPHIAPDSGAIQEAPSSCDSIHERCWRRSRREAVQQQGNPGDADHTIAGVHSSFLVFGEPSISAEPREGAFHDPTLRKQYETLRFGWSTYDFQSPGTIPHASTSGEAMSLVDSLLASDHVLFTLDDAWNANLLALGAKRHRLNDLQRSMQIANGHAFRSGFHIAVAPSPRPDYSHRRIPPR
jgi:hypothetical protein